jgi:hypothetical protein
VDRGYIKLWRKVAENPVLHERGKVFSKFEAWLYLCLHARGTASAGLQRGEFQYSLRFLSRAWVWGKGKVERFMADLASGEDPMIMRVGQQTGQQTGQFEGRFIICKYNIYNPTRDSKRDTLRDSKRDKCNEGFNEVLKKTTPPTPKGALCALGKCNGNSETCQELFNRFWAAYPRHEPSRKQALKSWCKIRPASEVVKLMISWIANAKGSDQWSDPTKIPHATTWLNQERWTGAEPPPKPAGFWDKPLED